LEALIRQEGSRYAAECSRVRACAEADSPEGALVELEKLLAERLPAMGDSLAGDEPLVLVVALYCGRIASAANPES